MISAVIDTNVIVSAMLHRTGTPGMIVELALRGVIQPVFNRAILIEYGQVLRRPRFDFVEAEVRLMVETIEGIGLETQEGVWPEAVPDEEDGKFLVAAAAGDAVLITGNLRDHPSSARRHVRVLSPREFMDRYANQILPFPTRPPK